MSTTTARTRERAAPKRAPAAAPLDAAFLAALDRAAERVQPYPTRCPACRDERVREAVRRWLERMARERSGLKLQHLHPLLVEHFAYRSKVDALRRHVELHEPELWAAAKIR